MGEVEEVLVARAAVLFDVPAEETADDQCSTSSSSIGRNSDVSSERSIEEGENEVESVYLGPLHAMETLEEVLPIRRGISKFYNGKSKSFTTLVDAVSSPSVKDIAKPENAYTRRRRNLMSLNHVYDKNNKSYPFRSSGGGICKRSISLSKSSLALAVAMNNSESNSSITSEDSGSSSNFLPSPLSLPPLHPRNRVPSSGTGPSSPSLQQFSPWRSFSLADLQHHCAIAATMKISSSTIGNEAAHGSS